MRSVRRLRGLRLRRQHTQGSTWPVVLLDASSGRWAVMTDFNGEVLALDLATSTGWCTGVPGGKPRFGSLRFGNASADRPARYRAMRDWLSVMITPKTRRVIFESSAVPSIMMGRTNIDTIKLLVGFC